MNEYYLTFGQTHPLRDHYVAIKANSMEEARNAAFEILGNKWAFMYTDKPNPENCPEGQVGRIIEARAFVDDDQDFDEVYK